MIQNPNSPIRKAAVAYAAKEAREWERTQHADDDVSPGIEDELDDAYMQGARDMLQHMKVYVDA